MSFFKQFPRIEYDVELNGIRRNVVDIYRYVDLIEEAADDVLAYKFVDVEDGERPDQLSQRLYGSPDYYWTFFITNDFLKDGISAWHKSSNELNDYIDYIYDDSYAVISVPQSGLLDQNDTTTLVGSPFINDTRYSSDVWLTAEDSDSVAMIKIVEFDDERYQLWLDKTEQHYLTDSDITISPLVDKTTSIEVDQSNMVVWYKFDRDYGFDDENRFIENEAPGKQTTREDYGDIVDSTGYIEYPEVHPSGGWAGTEYTLPDLYSPRSRPSENVPTWSENEGAYFFDGINHYASLYGDYEKLDDGTVISGLGNVSPVTAFNYFGSSSNWENRYNIGAFTLKDTENWSVAFWYKGDMGSGLSSESEGENGPIAAGWFGGIGIIDGKLSVWFTDDDSDSSTGPNPYFLSPFTTYPSGYDDPSTLAIQSTTPINDDEWHHCAVTFSNQGKILKIYVDGNLEGSIVSDMDFYHRTTTIGPTPLYSFRFEFAIQLKYLMIGWTPIDSDSSTEDDSAGYVGTDLESYQHTRGYLKDFRIYNSTLDDTNLRRFFSVRYNITDANASTEGQDLFFGWDKQQNHYQTYSISYIPQDSDDPYLDDWDSDVIDYNLNNTEAITGYGNAIQIRGYDYWLDSSLAPNYYTNKTLQIPVYYSDALWDDEDTPSEIRYIAFPGNSVNTGTSVSVGYDSGEEVEFYPSTSYPASKNGYYPKGYVFYIESSRDWSWGSTDYTYLPLMRDEDYASERYIAPIIGDGTQKVMFVGESENSNLTYRLSARAVITDDPPLEISAESVTTSGDTVYVEFSPVPGYRHVLYHKPPSGWPTTPGMTLSTDPNLYGTATGIRGYVDHCNVPHIVHTGSEDTPTTFTVDSRWFPFSDGVGDFLIFAFKIAEPDENEVISVITPYDALSGDVSIVNVTEKEGFLAYRNQDYITNRGLEEERNEASRTIKVVKAGYVRKFGDDYRGFLRR